MNKPSQIHAQIISDELDRLLIAGACFEARVVLVPDGHVLWRIKHAIGSMWFDLRRWRVHDETDSDKF